MDIKLAAVEGFKRYNEVWEIADFWKRANTFEAGLNLVRVAQSRWPADDKIVAMAKPIQEIISKNIEFFQEKYDRTGIWADDYGWWGIAALRAWDYSRAHARPEDAEKCLKVAQTCWQKMHSIGYDSESKAKPIPHGCFNRAQGDEGGTKNTVTNANFLVLCVRLHEAVPSDEAYLRMSYSQYQWFKAWFDYKEEQQERYLWKNLVHERPRGKPDYMHDDRPDWQEGWVWTGDQGLLLGAFAGLLRVKSDFKKIDPKFDVPGFERDVTNFIRDLSTGLTDLLFSSEDHVLREAPFNSSFGSNYGWDYVGGRGVLLRYLSDSNVRTFLGHDFDVQLNATAQAAWESRNPSNNQVSVYWNQRNDESFAKTFSKAWGYPDNIIVKWGYDAENPDGAAILQAMGLDALSAAIAIRP